MVVQGNGMLRMLYGIDERGMATNYGEDIMLYHSQQITKEFGREDWFYYEHGGVSSSEAIAKATAYFQDDREFQIFIEGYEKPWIYFMQSRLAVALRRRLQQSGAEVRPNRQYKIFPKPEGVMRPDSCDSTSQI